MPLYDLLNNASIWLDTTSQSDFVLSGSNVTTWKDKTSNNFNLTSTGTITYNSASPTSVLISTGAYFGPQNSFNILTPLQTWFFVVSSSTSLEQAIVVGMNTSGSNFNVYGFNYVISTTRFYIYDHGSSGDGIGFNHNFVPNTKYLFSISFNINTSTSYTAAKANSIMRLNGTTKPLISYNGGSNRTSYNLASNGATTQLLIGALNVGGSIISSKSFNIHELIGINNQALGINDIKTIETYLNTKWNLGLTIEFGQINALSLYLSGSLNSVSVANPSYNVPAATSALSTPSVSVYATNIVASGVGFAVNSDERIKKNIQYLNSTDSFELVKALKPASFQYVDFLKGTIPKYGYLAQEVESVLPYTVNKNTGYIPNFFETVRIEKENNIILQEKTTETLAIGTKLQFYDMEDMVLFRQVVEIMDEKTFMVNESFSLERESIFLYGQEVEDYRSIDTDQMNTILLSAVQDTQNIMENLDKEIDDLEKMHN